MFAFIIVMILLTVGYVFFWKWGNKTGEEQERARRQALHEKLARTRDEKIIAEHVDEHEGDR